MLLAWLDSDKQSGFSAAALSQPIREEKSRKNIGIMRETKKKMQRVRKENTRETRKKEEREETEIEGRQKWSV